MHIVICDDEQKIREAMRKKVELYLEEKQINANIICYTCGEELLKEKRHKVDLYLMDVEMSGMNGIETARMIRQYNKSAILIFTTAHLEYATEGYSVNAYRYLLKPISYEKLKLELDGAFREIRQSQSRIFLNTCEGEKMAVPVGKLLFISAYGHETHCHMEDGSVIKTKKTLKQFCELLCLYDFFQVHKSYLVNMEKIERVQADAVVMSSQEKITVSRHRMKDFKYALLKKWEGRLS